MSAAHIAVPGAGPQTTDVVESPGAAVAGARGHRRGRLFRKYLAILVLLVGGALATSGALELLFSYQEYRQALGRIQQEQAAAAATVVRQFVQTIDRALGWVTQPPPAAAALTLEEREADYLRIMRQELAINELAYIDAQGRECLRVSRIAVTRRGCQADLSRDPRFTVPKANAAYFSPVYFRNDSEPYMSLAQVDNGPERGVTAAEVNLKLIWDTISWIKIGQAGYAYVVDGTGHLVAHPDISLVLQKTDLSALSQVRGALARTAARPGATSGLPSSETLEGRAPKPSGQQGERVLASVAVADPPGWLVLVQQPLDEALAPLYASLLRTALLLALGVAISAGASLMIARRLLRPIQALQAGAERIGAGQLDQQIEIRSGDELESLADAFNQMAVELKEYYATLEQRVDVARAREIQQRLLPKSLPAWPGRLEIGWRFRSARDMSGDFYDVWELPADGAATLKPLQIAVGDVQGKGIAAALVMSLAQATLRAVAQPSPAAALRLTGRLMNRGIGRRDFVACALAVVEPGSEDDAMRLRLANAAQVPPLLCRDGAAEELNPPGDRLPMAIMPDPGYEEVAVDLQSGDVVVLATDGLPEAPREGELFGFERLAASAARWSAERQDADGIAAGIWEDVVAWCGEESHHDDMTLLVLRVPGGGAEATDVVE